MYFIGNGDFRLPFGFIDFLYDYLFIWSYKTGSINLDGIFRSFGRIPNILVFYFTDNNIVTSYFFIFLSFFISFFAFYFFSREFLGVKDKHNIIILVSLLFSFNPVFLQNSYKLGLNIAVALLLVVLIFIKKFFETQKYKFLFFASFILFLSIIHPFTLIVNAGISFLYFLICFINKKNNLSKKILVVILLSLSANAYILIPVFTINSFDKSILLNAIESPDGEKNTLLDFVNTRGTVNSFAMVEPVFEEIEPFNDSYKGLYLLSIFLLYFVTFALYFFGEKRKSKVDTIISSFALFFLLLFLIIPTSELFGSKIFLQFLNDLPGGWIFRSALKWQLYIPVALLMILIIQIKYIKSLKIKKIISVFLMFTFIFSNLYIFKDLYNKLLIPKKISTSNLINKDLKEGRLLLVYDSKCFSKDIMNKINQIMISKEIQFRRVNKKDFKNSLLYNFNNILTCDEINNDNFYFKDSYFEDSILLFTKEESRESVYLFDQLFYLNEINLIEHKKKIKNFNFTDEKKSIENKSVINLTERLEGNTNLIENNSFENGTWQEKVGNCYKYDDNPILSMSLDEDNKTDGMKSLKLEAKRHHACTSKQVILDQDKTYYIKFDYQSPNSDEMVSRIRFDGSSSNGIYIRRNIINKNWHTFHGIFDVPNSINKVDLFVYALSKDGSYSVVNRYDNFVLNKINIPEEILLEKKYSKEIDTKKINPTKRKVTLKNIGEPVFLGLEESYSQYWSLFLDNSKVNGIIDSWWPFVDSDKISKNNHYKLNGLVNAWYINPIDLCNSNEGCKINSDGSYDINIIIEFYPQRFVYLGFLITFITLLGVGGYFLYNSKIKIQD